jgi:hypothetical protein
MRRSQWNMCGKKRRFRSQHDATWSARRVQQNGAQADSHLAHSYWCPHCKGYHVGRNRKAVDE